MKSGNITVNMTESKDIKIDKIIKTKRKTVMMQITKDAQLIVRAPKYTPNFVIKIAVQKRAQWIHKNQKKMREKINNSLTGGKKRFVDNEKFLFLGQIYKLKIVSDLHTPLVLDEQTGEFLLAVIFPHDEEEARELFIKWYKSRALEIILPCVGKFARKYNLHQYNKIRVSDARSRWGSCSSEGNLNFSWRLVMASREVVDYVVIHELAHLKERNHGTQFWALVEKMCPEYKERKKWLKNNGHMLDI